ncbi:MAG: DUF1801 domain-containing protein [Saprospiraceae bacterium]|mgnify:FL=1
MQSKATTVAAYLDELPEDRKAPMNQLHKVIKKNLPKGFKDSMSYGMITYVVPHTIYPAGYHCDPKQELPFMSIASQKQFVAVYHMGIYADTGLLDWFTEAYAALGIGKLDMGKSCIRFKNTAKIPYDLIGELAAKLTPQQWIAMYEKNLKR